MVARRLYAGSNRHGRYAGPYPTMVLFLKVPVAVSESGRFRPERCSGMSTTRIFVVSLAGRPMGR